MERRVKSGGLIILVAGLALCGCSSSNRDAGNLGTRVCIENQSSTSANVGFTKRDTGRGEGPLTAGSWACGEGTFFIGDDVEGTITLASPLSEVEVTASNPWAGPPQTRIYINGRWCAGGGMNVGEKSVWDDGVLRYTVQRIADGQWKEFTVTLADSEQPSVNGLPAKCPGLSPTREHI